MALGDEDEPELPKFLPWRHLAATWAVVARTLCTGAGRQREAAGREFRPGCRLRSAP